MRTHLWFKVVAATYLLLVTTLVGGSPQFQAAFENALVEIQNADSDKGTGNVFSEFESLLKLGSREDIAQSVAGVWANPERMDVWSSASSLAGLLGPQFDRTTILKSVKDSLSHSFTVNANQSAVMASAQFLCNYGTSDDVELVKRFAGEIKQRNPELASRLEATLLGRENMIALTKAVEASKAKDQPKAQTAPKPSPAGQPPTPKRTPEAKPTTSTPQSIIVVLIVAALGLLRLWLKRRK